MTINELIQTAHADAKAKGWWDEPRNTGDLLMLIVSECGEALEAHRSGKRADLKAHDVILSSHPHLVNVTFKDHIKDTFEDELADIVIRIADWMGANGWTQRTTPQHNMVVPENVGEALYDIDRKITNDRWSLCDAMDRCFSLANAHNIDLWRHIELKLAYNRTRPHKHGKLY